MMKSKLNSQAGELALQQGMTAARAGYKNLASVQLERAAELMPDNADVWLWLAWLANSPDNTRRCLQQVLAITPGHPAATAGLIWVNSLTADDSAIGRSDPHIERNSTSPEALIAAESRFVEAVAQHSAQIVEPTAPTLLEEVDPRDGLDATPSTDLSLDLESKKADSEKTYDSDGWEVSVSTPIEATKVAAIESGIIGTPATLSSVNQSSVDAPVSDEESRRRRWNDLVSRAAEMPLKTHSKTLTVETEKNSTLDVAAPAAEVSASSDSITAPIVAEPPMAEASTAPVAEVPAPEAAVQSRFTDVPATTPRAELSNATINDSIIRLRQSTTVTSNRAPEPEADSPADIEKLAQSFNPLTDAVAADGRPLVMVVDDSPTVRKLVSLTLERRGYRVISAFDGVAAIKELGSNRPDLILLDINMPRLDGYRLCKLIKKHEATQSIPVVMLSGKDGMFDKLRGRLVGCSDYITKPFEADALTVKVAKYLTPATASTV